MIASLMMYDRPELAEAHAAYWGLIRSALAARGIAAPDVLRNDLPGMEVWTDPALVLSQTCGMPYARRLAGQVQLVGTPDFGLPECPPGYYRSVVVVRSEDTRMALAEFSGARLAYNDELSQSGYNAIYGAAREAGFWFDDLHCTGAHAASARAVAEGQADIAALDAVSWRLMQRYGDVGAALKVIVETPPTPGLPYVTAAAMPADAVFEAVEEALAALPTGHRDALGIVGLVRVPHAAYMAVPMAPEMAA